MRGLRLLTLGLLTSLTVFAATPAKAAILLEPYIGYELGRLNYTSANANFDLSSANLGLRLGVAFPVVFIAADYSTLLGGSLKQDDGNSTKWDASGNQLFAEVGVSLPMIRAYAGYGLLNTLEEKLNGVDNKYEAGTAIKLGVGTTVFPLVAVNIEYIYSNYDKVNGSSANTSKSNFYMLDLSLPFEF